VIKRGSDISAKKKVLNAFKDKGYIIEEEKEDRKTQERKIVDELIFFAGAILMVVGFLKENYYILAIGLALMFASISLLHMLLKLPKEGASAKKERKIVSRVDVILKKEEALKQKEAMLKKEIEDIYRKAQELRGKEIALNKKSDEIKKKEAALNQKPTIIIEKGLEDDVKKVLQLTDTLLEKLPDEEIEKFAKTKEFELYKKVMKEIR